MTNWHNYSAIGPQRYTCGYCDSMVASSHGFVTKHDNNGILKHSYICPNCDSPTLFIYDFRGDILHQGPSANFGNPVNNLPPLVEKMYNEGRICIGNQCYTAGIMICRKILMHIAVEKEAEENLGFRDYVDYLDNEGYLPPDSRKWVDHIRHQGNEANHKIIPKDERDAKKLIKFIEMLTRFIYEFPASISDHES